MIESVLDKYLTVADSLMVDDLEWEAILHERQAERMSGLGMTNLAEDSWQRACDARREMGAIVTPVFLGNTSYGL